MFNSLVQNEKRIEAGGNTLQTDQNAAKARTDGEAIQTLQITANRKSLSDALTEQRNASKKPVEPPQPLETSPMMSKRN